jgi:hypothetical protein
MLLVTCALGKFPFKTDKGYFGLASLISEGPPPQLSYVTLAIPHRMNNDMV